MFASYIHTVRWAIVFTEVAISKTQQYYMLRIYTDIKDSEHLHIKLSAGDPGSSGKGVKEEI